MRLCGPETQSVKQVIMPVTPAMPPTRPSSARGARGPAPSAVAAPPPAALPEALAGPLDRAVRGLFGVSWGKARGWISSGKVRVDGQVATEVTRRVAAGAQVSFDERAPRVRGVGVEARGPGVGRLSDSDVIFVDAQVIVVAKPAGLSTVPYDESETDTLEARVRTWLDTRSRGKGRPTVGVVHRIDKETSGLVVFTRTWAAKQSLASQFRQHTVHRRYFAVAHGDVRTRTFTTWLVENRGDGLRGSARGRPPPDAREAITHVERLEALDGATLVACRLETGRTHQIRIHLSESGHPLVGERVYVRGFAGPPIEAPRLMLHAAELGFVHPTTNLEARWELPIPADMQVVIERLRAR
jgi:23S rRNA pseudouridine1911/1915/1917 synthase